MLAAMEGAISATDRPTACHTESERRSDLPSRTGAVIGVPLDENGPLRSVIPALSFVQACPIRACGPLGRTYPKGTPVDLADRESRMSRAEDLVRDLADRGVVAVATSFVDNAGISRAKSVPLDRLPALAP